MWVSAHADDLTHWSYQASNRYIEQWELRLHELTASQWAALRNFFYNTVKGPQTTFTYTHTDGESYQANFINERLEASRRDSNTFQTTIRLELVFDQVNGAPIGT